MDGQDIIKGYQVSKGHYIEITDEDLEAVSVESTRTIDIDQFVPREETARSCGDGCPKATAPRAIEWRMTREQTAASRLRARSREYPRAGDPFALNVLFDQVFIERGA